MIKINFNHLQESYLSGQLLIATPVIKSDSIFNKAVILVVSNNSSGSIGVVVNSPIDKFQSSFILNSLNKNQVNIQDNTPIYFGGPVEPGRGFILHSNDYNKDPLFKLNNGIAVSSSVQILKDIADGVGPAMSLFAIGCTGWEKGQLEEEVFNNNWLTVPFSEELVFGANNYEKWDLAMHSLGIKNYALNMSIGHA